MIDFYPKVGLFLVGQQHCLVNNFRRLLILTPFRMGHFGAAYLLPKIYYTYPE